MRGNLHLPFEEGECTICHELEKVMTDRDYTVICLDCHEIEDQDGRHDGFEKAQRGCLSCHLPHAVNHPVYRTKEILKD